MSDPAPDISDKEFYDEVRRGLLIVIGAMLRKYRLTWMDFLPREGNAYIRRLIENQSPVMHDSQSHNRPDGWSTSLPVANP
jgi:hypothetical protein